MTQESLSKWLKGVIAGIAVCGAVIYFYLVPVFGQEAEAAYPEFSHCYIPWLIGRSLLYGAVFWMEDYHGN